MKRAYVKFYTDWLDAIEELTKEEQFSIIKRIIRYGADPEQLNNLSGLEKIVSIPIKREIDEERERNERINEQRRTNGRLGGRPKKDITKRINDNHMDNEEPYGYQKENIPPCPPKEKKKERTKERIKEITPLYPPLKEKGEEKTCVFSVGTPIGAHDPHPSLYLSIYLLNIWNEIFSEKLPKITKITEQRKAKINSRLPLWEKLAQERNCDIETLLTEVFNKIKDSKFLLGDNDRGWRADFDWFIQSDKQTMKILEGGYENVETKQKGLTEVEKLYGKNDINSYWAKRAKELGKSI